MKISQLVNEDFDIDEAIWGTKQWRRERSVDKDIKADKRDMSSDLKTWMRGSGLKNVTIDQFKDFLNQKGLDPSTVDSLASDRARGRTGIPPDAPMTSAEVQQYLDKAVRSGYQSTGASGTQSRFGRTTIPNPLGGRTGGASGGSSLPSSVNSAISGLTPAQKAALKAML